MYNFVPKSDAVRIHHMLHHCTSSAKSGYLTSHKNCEIATIICSNILYLAIEIEHCDKIEPETMHIVDHMNSEYMLLTSTKLLFFIIMYIAIGGITS